MKFILGILVLAIVSYTLAQMLFSLSGFLGLFIIGFLTFINIFKGTRR